MEEHAAKRALEHLLETPDDEVIVVLTVVASVYGRVIVNLELARPVTLAPPDPPEPPQKTYRMEAETGYYVRGRKAGN